MSACPVQDSDDFRACIGIFLKKNKEKRKKNCTKSENVIYCFLSEKGNSLYRR